MAREKNPRHFSRKLGIGSHGSRVKSSGRSVIVRPIKGNFVSIHEYEQRGDAVGSSQRGDTLNDRVWCREFSESAALDDLTCGQVEEAICALEVTGGTKTNGRNAAGFHAVGRVIFFMDLAIRAEGGTTMTLGIEFVPKDDFPGTELR